MNQFDIVDMHCDTLSATLSGSFAGQKADLRRQNTQINFEKLKESGYFLQNFAAFVDMGESEDPLEDTLRMADLFYRQTEASSDLIVPVKSWKDIERSRSQGKMAALLTLEEGGICRGDPALLSVLYRLGARMMTLTWNYENELGFPNFDLRKPLKHPPVTDEIQDPTVPGDSRFEDLSGRGLKERGIFFLEEMERLGMIIDVSHLSDAGFYDVLNHTKKPFVASHSNARSLWPAKRNLTDDMIRKLADRGGVTGINFCMAFLGRPETGEDFLDQAVRHMKYLINLGGEDFVGFGSDFDGIDAYDDLKDCTAMPRLIDRMKKADLSYTQIEKICSGNVLRVYKELLS